MGHTFVEKVLARKAGLESVVPGQIVTVRPDKLLTHDNTSAIAGQFRKIGVDKVAVPTMNVIVLDHVTPAANETYASGHKAVREFVAEQGITAFYDIGEGICHQVLPEKGHAWPGGVIVGSDSHTPTHGAFGAFAAGIGRTEAAAVMATGQIWLRVPYTFRIVVNGTLPERVSAKDVILHIIGDLLADGADYRSVEFAGQTIRDMSVAGRMVLTNMAAEMGAKNAVVEPDDKTRAWLKGRVKHGYEEVFADPDASYERVIEYDVSDLAPQVAKPHTVDNVVDVTEVAGTPTEGWRIWKQRPRSCAASTSRRTCVCWCYPPRARYCWLPSRKASSAAWSPPGRRCSTPAAAPAWGRTRAAWPPPRRPSRRPTAISRVAWAPRRHSSTWAARPPWPLRR